MQNCNKYSPRFKIHFKWNPMAQVVLGRFDGYMLMLEAFNDVRDFKNGDKVEFVYSSQSQWNKCIKHISKQLAA